ncbi:MAG: pentapeptide repeat-containing protein [Pseudomonadota bacterium]
MALIDLLLADDVEGFNAARGRRSSPALGAVDLSGRALAGVDLTHADLENADLSGTDLQGAVLVQARLDGADLTGADLRGAMAHRSRWRGAYLGQARMEGVELPRADLTDAELPEVDAEGIDLSGAKLRGADLSGARMPGAELSEAQLNNAILAGAKLPGARLVAAQLGKADLSGADLSDADLSGARLSGVNAAGALLVRANLTGADLTGADLTGADLTGADLTRADLGEAKLDGAKLDGTIVREARLDGVALGNVALAGAVLDDASLGAPPEDDQPPSQGLMFEDIAGCVSNGSVGLLWENQDEPGLARLRVAVVGPDGRWDGRALALPEPADLVVARGLLPASFGFQALLFVQRPGGLICRATEISPQGDVGTTRSLACDVVPAVRPVFFAGAEGPLVALLSRRGPGIHVMAVEEAGLVARARQPLATANAFIDGLEPAVLTKGGIVLPLGEAGLGPAVSVPEGFPGRAAAAARHGSDLFLAWIPRAGHGLAWAVLTPGEPPQQGLLARRASVGSLDCVAVGDQVLALWTEEGDDPGDASCLRGVLLPDGRPFPVLDDELEEPDQVRILAGGAEPLVSVISGSGSVCLLAVRPGGARLLARLG